MCWTSLIDPRFPCAAPWGFLLRLAGITTGTVIAGGGIIQCSSEATFTVPGVGSASVDEDFDGFRFGGGVEGMVWGNVSARAEYTYTIYDDPDVFPGVDVDANQPLFRIGVAYYF